MIPYDIRLPSYDASSTVILVLTMPTPVDHTLYKLAFTGYSTSTICLLRLEPNSQLPSLSIMGDILTVSPTSTVQ